MWEAFGFLVGVGAVSAIGLGVASRVFYVKEDPRIEKVADFLPGANCGGCGFAGCAACAEAIVKRQAPATACVVGGPDVHSQVGSLMGIEIVKAEPRQIDNECTGGIRATKKLIYMGIQDCRAANRLFDGPIACDRGCLGLGTCVQVCPFQAITLDKNGLPEFDPDLCRSCGTCVAACPRGVIELISMSRRILHFQNKEECLSPCQQACPAQVDIPAFIGAIQQQDYQRALNIIRERIPLPLAICRICPHPCEQTCRRNITDEPVAVNPLKRFVADLEYESGIRYREPMLPDTNHKVAVIGGGPSGLACAYYLRRLGHSVTIFEAQPQLGGMLRYGVPEYRLPKKILDWEIKGILDLGIEARTNVTFGKDFGAGFLYSLGFQAIHIAVGAWKSFDLGDSPDQVIQGKEFLEGNIKGHHFDLGKRVIVIGGGNSACDVARTAVRNGVESVTMVCLEGREEMPALEEEVIESIEENVNIMNSWGLNRYLTRNGQLTGVELKRCTRVFDENGRFSPEYDPTDTISLDADNVILSIGMTPDIEYFQDRPRLKELKLTPRSTVIADAETQETSLPDVFAGGDCHYGPNIAAQAINSGRLSARSIHYKITSADIPPIKNKLTAVRPESLLTELPGVEPSKREKQPHLSSKERIDNFREIYDRYSEDQALREASRCLQCGVFCYTKCLTVN